MSGALKYKPTMILGSFTAMSCERKGRMYQQAAVDKKVNKLGLECIKFNRQIFMAFDQFVSKPKHSPIPI